MTTSFNVLLIRRFSSKVLFYDLTENNARVMCDYLRKLDKKSKFQYSFEKSK